MITVPALLFVLVAATAATGLYHLILGRTLRQLPLFWLGSVVGFAAAQIVGPFLPLHLPPLGRLYLGEGLIAAVVLMTVVRMYRL